MLHKFLVFYAGEQGNNSLVGSSGWSNTSRWSSAAHQRSTLFEHDAPSSTGRAQGTWVIRVARHRSLHGWISTKNSREILSADFAISTVLFTSMIQFTIAPFCGGFPILQRIKSKGTCMFLLLYPFINNSRKKQLDLSIRFRENWDSQSVYIVSIYTLCRWRELGTESSNVCSGDFFFFIFSTEKAISYIRVV